MRSTTPSERRKELIDLLVHEYPLVIRFVMRLGASLPDAEMIVQDVYAETWRSLARQNDLPPVSVEVRSALRKAAYLKYMQPAGIQQPLPGAIARNLRDTSANPANNYVDLTPGTSFVLRALHNLDPLHRSVLAFHMEGFSISEIAVQLGIDNDLATSAFNKARSTMAHELAGCRVQERRVP